MSRDQNESKQKTTVVIGSFLVERGWVLAKLSTYYSILSTQMILHSALRAGSFASGPPSLRCPLRSCLPRRRVRAGFFAWGAFDYLPIAYFGRDMNVGTKKQLTCRVSVATVGPDTSGEYTPRLSGSAFAIKRMGRGQQRAGKIKRCHRSVAVMVAEPHRPSPILLIQVTQILRPTKNRDILNGTFFRISKG